MAKHRVKVRGHGRFPDDMLRYDRLAPATEEDARKIEEKTNTAATYEVDLVREGPRQWTPTRGRWSSFLWGVAEHEVEDPTRQPTVQQDRFENEDPKPTLELAGQDGNAFAILGRAKKVGRRAGWSPERIKEVINEATSGDYDHLLATMARHFEIV